MEICNIIWDWPKCSMPFVKYVRLKRTTTTSNNKCLDLGVVFKEKDTTQFESVRNTKGRTEYNTASVQSKSILLNIQAESLCRCLNVPPPVEIYC